MRVGEWALAETNDVGVPQMKIGREPNVSHHPYYLRSRATLCSRDLCPTACAARPEAPGQGINKRCENRSLLRAFAKIRVAPLC
jgi:hypothetical protein